MSTALDDSGSQKEGVQLFYDTLHYYGVVIDDPEILHRYAEEYPHEGILGNHKNRYAFLRNRGYVD